MSSQKKMAIMAISTVMLTRKHYLESHSTRQHDSKELPIWTDDPNKAMDFGTEDAARQLIPNLLNHMDRVFTPETILVDVKFRRAAITEQLK